MKHFLNNHFTNEEVKLIEESQKARIDTQYYSDRNISDETYERIIKGTALFFARGKEILNKINENLIKQIREEIDKIIKEMD
jgi:uncharacterized protein (UPF0332 family)